MEKDLITWRMNYAKFPTCQSILILGGGSIGIKIPTKWLDMLAHLPLRPTRVLILARDGAHQLFSTLYSYQTRFWDGWDDRTVRLPSIGVTVEFPWVIFPWVIQRSSRDPSYVSYIYKSTIQIINPFRTSHYLTWSPYMPYEYSSYSKGMDGIEPFIWQ